MANEKISAMPLATLPLAGTEIVPLVQAGNNVQVPLTDLPTPTAKIRVVVANATAVSGETIVVDTTAGAVTVTLPAAPNDGDSVTVTNLNIANTSTVSTGAKVFKTTLNPDGLNTWNNNGSAVFTYTAASGGWLISSYYRVAA